ncbi:molybdopterin-binding protein [Brevibacterium sp. BRM-1]|uniref:molybdopterin-binding protein n=1 Tax=Brevibacterium sp. BRM-1 TaxID=2999062 RepID=UPI00227FAF63|nr:molybdopterin-binding protein [Brevibacterium sp. BRM-1]WAL39802.1 molybdopterin-binding protein [Brevibacterium sp. BRM-1]
MDDDAPFGAGRRAAVIVCVRGGFDPAAPPDHNGARAVEWLRERGYETPDSVLVANGPAFGPALDAALEPGGARSTARASASAARGAGLPDPASVPRFVLTLGGTGLNPRDRTPQLTAERLDYEVPGIVHAIWARGLENTATAIMSRGTAGVAGRTFVLNLPSSRGGVKDGLAVLGTVAPLIQAQIEDPA